MGFIASAILSPLCKRLINTAWQEYELVRDVKEEVGKLRFTVSLIQEVLQDAEQKQVKEGVVRHWLRSLKQLLYDAEDILDEAATDYALETRRVEYGTSRSVNPIFGGIDNILSRRDLAHQIKDIRMQLDAIYKEKDALRLEGLTSENIGPAVNTKRRRVDTSSLMADKPCIVGRDDEKRKIMEMLMGSELETSTSEPTSSNNSNVHVLSLVGMGGVGKTTLAKLVFSDPTVKQHFHNVMIWVCVSENFDVNRITTEILEVISKDQQKESFEISMNWDSAQQRLKAKIEGKKFLLVLDDVWEQDPYKWESLYGPLTYGGKGSRIIVTTRNQKVSNMVKASCVPLKSLSDEDLWPILKSYAFDGGSESHGLLESIGRQMVKKLKGSPLAAKTIGRLLNQSLDVWRWKDILDSEIFMLEQQHPDDISPVLKLSYDHLPGHLKQCFAYCSLFPKDYRFSRSELAPHWVAQNFIETTRGYQHFDDLLDMSFFEESTYDSRYVMHDLVHDLAESISKDDCFRLGDDDRCNKFSEAIRHVSIVTKHLDPMKLEELFKYGKLRTLHFLGRPRFDLSPLLLDNLFMKLKRLRVLGLRECGISELPTSVGNLKHLRFVDLSCTDISEIPESFCGLYNLQVLKLQDCCELRALPGNTSALVNLMHLEVTDEALVSRIQDLGKLTALQELNIWGVKAKELGDMSMLRHLHIRNLQEVIGKEEAAQARLDAKKYLKTLTLGWAYWRADQPSFDDHGALEEEEEEGVLEGLQPANNIRKLSIYNYGGVRSPRWLEDPSWVSSSFLERVELTDCKKWEVLPPLGQLRGLKYLEISGMSSVRRINPMFFLGGCYSPGQGGGGGGFEMLSFPSLESLNFTNMPEWEAPHHGDDGDEEGQQQQISFLPRLHTLEISDCPKLKELSPLPRSLKSLNIQRVGLTLLPRLVGCCGDGGAGRDADHMSSSSPSSPSLSELYIRDCPNLRSPDDGDDDDEEGQQQQISFLPRLHTLEISDCPKLKELPPLPRSLKSLNIQRVGLTLLPRLVGCCGDGGAGRDADHMSSSSPSSPSLSELYIRDCPNLRSPDDGDDDEEEGQQQHISFLPRLHRLQISDCPKLKELPPLPRSLKSLNIQRVGMTRLPRLVGCCGHGGAGRDADHMSSPSLSVLSIDYCPNLRSPIDWRHTGLSSLSIRGYRELTSFSSSSSSSLPSVSTADEANMPCPLEVDIIDGGDMVEYLLVPSILPKLTCLSELHVILGSLSTAQLLLNGILQNQPVTATLRTLVIRRDYNPPLPPLEMEMEKVVVGPTNNIRDHLTSLTYLEIRDCSDLLQLSGLPSSLQSLRIYDDTFLDDRILATYLQGLCRLISLSIVDCPRITSLPTVEVLCHLTALQDLRISHCWKLMSWGGGVHNLIALQELIIKDCPKLQCLPSVGLPKSLRNVSIINYDLSIPHYGE